MLVLLRQWPDGLAEQLTAAVIRPQLITETAAVPSHDRRVFETEQVELEAGLVEDEGWTDSEPERGGRAERSNIQELSHGSASATHCCYQPSVSSSLTLVMCCSQHELSA